MNLQLNILTQVFFFFLVFGFFLVEFATHFLPLCQQLLCT